MRDREFLPPTAFSSQIRRSGTRSSRKERARSAAAEILRQREEARGIYHPNSAGLGAPESDDGGHVGYVALLWKQRLLILGSLFLGAFVRFAIVVTQPPLYKSTATIEMLDFNESFMGLNRVDPQAGTASYGATAPNIQTQIRILTSVSLLNRVTERLNLELPPISSVPPDLFSKLRNRLGLVDEEPVQIMRQAIQTAAGSVRAGGVGNSRLIEVTAESTSPEIAATFVNTLASEYISQNLQLRSSTAVRTMQWMKDQLEETRTRMRQAESRLQEFIRSRGLDFVTQESTLDNSKLAQLQAQLSAIQADRVAKATRYEIAKSSPIDSLPDILDDGRLRGLRDQLTGLRREKAQLLATLTPNHYRVQRVEAQIKEIEDTIQREKANLVRRIQNDHEAAVRQERLLAEAYQRQSRTVAAKADRATQYHTLRREVEMTQSVYDALLQQLNQASLVSAVPAHNIRVVDQATPANEPSKPKPLQDILFGAFVGGGLAFGVAYLYERRRVRMLGEVFGAPGDTSDLLCLPELGVIPSLGPLQPRGGLFRKSPGMQHMINGGNGARHDTSVSLIAKNKPAGLAESFRFTLTSLLGGRNERWRPVIVVTSAGPGEGKTTVASNLAIAMAETGRRVLLVDGDLWRARLHKTFQVPEGPGLAELLIQSEAEADPLQFVRSTAVPGLFLLTRGSENPESAARSLFLSSRITSLLRVLQRNFDAVLIDTAPALYFSEARLLGRLSDGIVLVVRAGTTHRRSVLMLQQRLASDGISVLGAVLNDWNTATAEQYYYPSAAEYHLYKSD
jgi:succinoglycan biosynthesis transport protein ExoP